MTLIITLITGLSCCFNIHGAPTFRADKVYPEMGLKMRVLGNSTPVALPQPKTYTYTLTQGDTSSKQNRYDPHELWYAEQQCGQWRDSDDNTLTIGRVLNNPPVFNQQHVLREQYDATISSTPTIDPENEGALKEWVARFALCQPQGTETLKISSNFALSNAMFLPVNDGGPLVYLFQVKIRTPAGQLIPSEWFCAVVHIKDGSDPEKVRKTFESQFLAKVAAAPRTYTTTKADISSKELKTSRTGSSTKIPDSPAREAARKSIANMNDWWYAETQEYIFLSDIRSSAGKSLVREMQHSMPYLRKAFTTLVPPFEPLTDASVVRIFEDALTYKQYVGTELEWSIGLWSPMRRELVILSQGKDQDKTLDIIKHEGFHQYLFHACNMVENLPWFNEGHACFFETAEISRRGKVTIPENSRVRHLLSNLDAATQHIPAVLAMSYRDFYSPTENLRSLNYTTAWALIYYLHKGAPLERSNPYKNILKTYLEELKTSRDANAATTKAFEDINMEEMREEFKTFWMRKRARARTYNPL